MPRVRTVIVQWQASVAPGTLRRVASPHAYQQAPAAVSSHATDATKPPEVGRRIPEAGSVAGSLQDRQAGGLRCWLGGAERDARGPE